MDKNLLFIQLTSSWTIKLYADIHTPGFLGSAPRLQACQQMPGWKQGQTHYPTPVAPEGRCGKRQLALAYFNCNHCIKFAR